MTDYFALLDQARQPWLDPEGLKEIFHAKTLRSHPDAQSSGDGSDSSAAAFAELNEAYQVLRDPKRRLHHFLALASELPTGQSSAIAPGLLEIFSAIAALTPRVEALLQDSGNASNALSRALIQSNATEVQQEVTATLDDVRQRYQKAETQLRRLNAPNETASADYFAELRALYLRLSYLTRWQAELEEKHLRLSQAF